MKTFLSYLSFLIQKHCFGILIVSWLVSIGTLFWSGVIVIYLSHDPTPSLASNLLWASGLLLIVPLAVIAIAVIVSCMKDWVEHQVWVYRRWKERQ